MIFGLHEHKFVEIHRKTYTGSSGGFFILPHEKTFTIITYRCIDSRHPNCMKHKQIRLDGDIAKEEEHNVET